MDVFKHAILGTGYPLPGEYDELPTHMYITMRAYRDVAFPAILALSISSSNLMVNLRLIIKRIQDFYVGLGKILYITSYQNLTMDISRCGNQTICLTADDATATQASS
jgi:hypothetical protein